MAVLPDMVGIVSFDLERSLRFYRLLGLTVPDPEPGSPYVEVITPNGYRISWNAVSMVRDLDPAWTEPAGGERMTLAFKCDDPAEVDTVYERMVSAGYKSHTKPWDAFWGQRYAIVEDPDGNNINLFAPLPVAAKST
ncbi:MAG: VOC family protein [Polyangiaceae bacterium]|jgi:catechol 2,3-dioxygenase-like lactoylglutathione lyase family enzyme|nr:VOC family protein [Polyangiaceae bacterium]